MIVRVYDARLRWTLLALVLVNLVFVQLTRAVADYWMVPLYALTAASPWLVLLQTRWIYRALWNATVLGVFALLVHHASRGVHFLLEDGLILAAFCQVHLLNNLDRQHKPDLLFFNSFLIALVTSFFSQDLAYAGVFAVYATLLLVAMQLECLSRPARASDARQRIEPFRLGASTRMRETWLRAGGNAAVVLGLTLLAFLFWPRDFQREGLVSDHLLRSRAEQAGTSEDMQLGRSAATVLSDRIVMQIRVLEGTDDLPRLWRGATHERFGAGRWHAIGNEQGFGLSLGERWQIDAQHQLTRPGHATRTRVAVRAAERGARRLLLPMQSHAVQLRGPSASHFLTPRIDGTVALFRDSVIPPDTPLEYELSLHAAHRPHSPRPRARVTGRLARYARLQTGVLPTEGREIARSIDARLGEDAPQHLVVEAVRAHLANGYEYLLPGVQGAARDLDDFFAGADGAHCEYFATALALMLRSLRIPCRLATGYACSEWNEDRSELLVRARHAHAWVEVRDPAGFWYPVDATPAASLDDELGAGALAALTDWLDEVWGMVAGFDDDSRAAALAWLRTSPQRLWAWARAEPLRAALYAAALAAMVWVLRRLRRRGRIAEVFAYELAVRRAGVRPIPGETPRELLERARGADVQGRRLEALEAATAAHERARYASSRPAPVRQPGGASPSPVG